MESLLQNEAMEGYYEPLSDGVGESLLNDDLSSNFSNADVVSVETSPLDELAVAPDNHFSEIDDETKRLVELEARKRYYSDPENQADILLRNYVNSQALRITNKVKKALRRKFLKNAKKGLYKKMFNEQIYGISKEESMKRFKKLN